MSLFTTQPCVDGNPSSVRCDRSYRIDRSTVLVVVYHLQIRRRSRDGSLSRSSNNAKTASRRPKRAPIMGGSISLITNFSMVPVVASSFNPNCSPRAANRWPFRARGGAISIASSYPENTLSDGLAEAACQCRCVIFRGQGGTARVVDREMDSVEPNTTPV
jgi:hypothetical protein